MSYSSGTSKSEIIDLSLSLVALVAAFSILGERQVPGIDIITISAVGAGSGFLLHELAHKFAAQRYGYWAEYRANWAGLVFMVVIAFMGIIFAAPGAVWMGKAGSAAPLYGDEVNPEQLKKEKREQLWIALAGPMTNIALTILFFLLLVSGVINSRWGFGAAYYALFINLTLAAFNLLPFGPLDGAKVFSASRPIWAIVAVPTILVALPMYFGMV
ncbi:MAG: site-2 protease family protein [Methanotrichaceae archaeon]|nr:site-2 protease family protein [Methanotrichaceae archaeon]